MVVYDLIDLFCFPEELYIMIYHLDTEMYVYEGYADELDDECCDLNTQPFGWYEVQSIDNPDLRFCHDRVPIVVINIDGGNEE